jgi:hypothetical protein
MIVPRSVPSRPRRLPGAAAGVLCAALLACSSGGDGPPVDPEPPATLPTGVYELAGIDASLPYTDLEPFRSIVGNTHFVALGESYHTSGGFYQAKGRLIRFMVEQMGFRVVMLETPWLEALPATEYVRSCTGTPEAALASLNGVWRDINVRHLLRWLCDYNRAHPADPVTFLGFDIQEPWRTIPALRQFVQAAAPGELARTEPLQRCLGAAYANGRDFFGSQQYRDVVEGRRDAAAHAQCIGAITDLESWIAASAPALQAASSASAVEEARIALISLRAWEDQIYVPDPAGYQARDHGMAQAILRLHALYTPGKKDGRVGVELAHRPALRGGARVERRSAGGGAAAGRPRHGLVPARRAGRRLPADRAHRLPGADQERDVSGGHGEPAGRGAAAAPARPGVPAGGPAPAAERHAAPARPDVPGEPRVGRPLSPVRRAAVPGVFTADVVIARRIKRLISYRSL